MGGKGSGGHNRKSLSQHLRDGTYRPHRHGPLPEDIRDLSQTRQEQAEVNNLECPEWLDDIAKAEWQRVSTALMSRGLLGAVDRSVLEAYCEAYSRWRKAVEVINKRGLTHGSGRTSVVRVRPEVRVARDALNQVRIYQRELGLIGGVTVVDKRDPFEELLDFCKESTS